MSQIPVPSASAVSSSGDDDDELQDVHLEQLDLKSTTEGKRRRRRKRKKRPVPQDDVSGEPNKNKIGKVSNSGDPSDTIQVSMPPPKKRRRTRTHSSGLGLKHKTPTRLNADSLPSDTIEPFSIYRIEVDNPPEKLQTEQNLQITTIENIMQKINNDAIKGCRSPYQFFEGKLPLDNHFSAQEDDTKPCFYQVCAYIQEQHYDDKFLPHIGIQKGYTGIQKLVFFHRPHPSEIFVLTFGQPCQAILPFCCPQFSSQIAGRLTTIDNKFQATLKSLNGVPTSRSLPKAITRVTSTRMNMGYNWVKDARPDASIFRLKEFTSRHQTQGKDSFKLRFDLGYVRIMTKIKVLHLPEILNHFGTICRGEPTYKYPSGEREEHIDLFPSVALATKEMSQEVDHILHKMVLSWMNQPNPKSIEFEFCPKLTEGFTVPITLTYNNVTVETFLECPTSYQVFHCLRRCPELMDTTDIESFVVQIKKCSLNIIKDNQREKHFVLDLLEGVILLGEACYWKTMGTWCIVRDEYHQQVHMEFLALLKKKDILFKPGEVGPLEIKWPSSESVANYVQPYRNMYGCFVPDNTPYMFDLMRVTKQKNGTSVFLYYIFEGFDAGIGDASARINKSLEMMFNPKVVSAPTTTPSTDTDNMTLETLDSNDTDENFLLKQFYNIQCSRDEFLSLFPTWSHFIQHLVNEKVSIVVALGIQKDIQFPKTFAKERDLEVVFTLHNVFSLIVCNLDFVTKQGVCMELDIDPDDNRELASKILEALVNERYCSEDGKVSGKLLKINCAQEFRIFFNSPSSTWLNVKVFEYIQPHFISQFSGFLQKLECFQIHETVVKNPRLCLKFTEVVVGNE